MGSQCLDTYQLTHPYRRILPADIMAFLSTFLTSSLCIGLALGDTSIVSSPSAQPLSSISSSDTSSSYYNTDPYEGYDYDAGYASLLQGEEDRQDVGFLGDISLAVIVTVFLAALLGALVAPAFTAGFSRVMDFEINIPEIEFPKIVEKNTIDDNLDNLDDIEIIEARSMKKKSPWMDMANAAVNLLEHKLAKQEIMTKNNL